MAGLSVLLVSISLIGVAFGAPAGDLVKSWPGTNTTDWGFDMYSGFLPIENSDGKEMHYVFATS
jgi:hypothetical protein